MLLIQQVTSDTLQKQTIVLEDGSSFTITLYFMPLQYGWFIQELIYGDFILRGVRVTNSPNILRQWKNKIPFGISCISKENREPYFIDDFSSGSSSLYVLTESEVQAYEDYLSA